MQVELAGLRALVTGSTRGIGQAIAVKLANSGATVAINGRTQVRVATTVAELGQAWPDARFEPATGDLTTAEGAAAVIAAAGEIDILVANAGVYTFKDPFELSDEDWLATFNANVLSGVRLARVFGPRMAARGWGRIIFIGSEAGVEPINGLAHYSASKAAQLSVARSFAQALATTGVTVNTVVPGPVTFPENEAQRAAHAATQGLTLEEATAQFFAGPWAGSLIKRHVKAEEVADLVAFLASREAGFASGAPWRADGGNIRHVV